MASVGEARRRLPREFTERLSACFPQHAAERILRGMCARRRTTLRVNTLRWDAASLVRFLRQNAVKYRRVPWYGDAFILEALTERAVQAWGPYRDGRIYVQGIASMVPVLVLSPQPGERILDIAAAPGSKTTQAAALMGNRGSILASERDPVRAQRLLYNIRLQGCAIVEVRVGRGEGLGSGMPGFFDRVLVDAPCSGEGRFLVKDPSSWRAWSPRAIAEAVRLQKKLLASAAAALRPGGTLVYSTCTLNQEENEGIVQWGIEALGLRPARSPLAVDGAWAGMARGRDPSIALALRMFPDRDREGFFVCRLIKG